MNAAYLRQLCGALALVSPGHTQLYAGYGSHWLTSNEIYQSRLTKITEPNDACTGRPTRLVMNDVPCPCYQDHLTLAALLTAAGYARLLVRYDLAVWSIAREHVETAELLVSELVTNAVKATGMTEPHPAYSDVHENLKLIGVRLRLIERTLVIEVWDSSPEPPIPKTHNLDTESGRGLFLVQSLSSRWGYYPIRQGGKVVWCELAITPTGMDDTIEMSRSLPRRARRVLLEPDGLVKPMRDSHLLKRVLEGLQQLNTDQEKER